MDGISTSSDTAGSYGTERQLQFAGRLSGSRTKNNFCSRLRNRIRFLTLAGMPCSDLCNPDNPAWEFYLPDKPFAFGEEFILVPMGLELNQLVIQLTELGFSVRTSPGSLEVTSTRSEGKGSYFAWIDYSGTSCQTEGDLGGAISSPSLQEALIYLWGIAKEGTRNFFRSGKAVFCSGSYARGGLSPLVCLIGGELHIELIEPDLLDRELRKRSLTQVHLLVAA